MRSRRVAFLALVVGLAFSAAALEARERGADGRFEKRRSSHFVLYQDVDIDESSGLRGSRRFEQQVLDTLERAYERLDRYLGLRPKRPITVVIYDPAIFDTRFASLFSFSAAGFYEGTIRIRGATQLHQPLIRVLHHEVVHAAFDAAAPSLALPAWLGEGLAEWFEARAAGKRHLSGPEVAFLTRASQQGGLFALADLSRPSLAHLGPEHARLAYLQSYAFVEYLARHHGERSLREFCLEFLRTGNLRRAFTRTFRADWVRLEQGFHSELRAGARR
ncbi:MAG: hypothetical protein V3T33_04045 [Myxococcota bacterium]